ncbi:MAG: 3-isopropylmalate/(R)-2-methylmalate dehydratase small subunit [Verrucomicrobiales bacterium]|jgi:3-isopropylmalate/(R)-2-methylmalate dehydratase small subunit
MALEKITKASGTAVHVPGSDIDTDRIIPARFMKCVTFDGLGDYLFYDVRNTEDGTPKPHPINDRPNAPILISGMNFGCGSSREHAPQALYRHGIRAVIAGSFAEIFFGNCTTLGIPCAAAAEEDLAKLAAAVDADPALEVSIDVDARRVKFGDESITVHIPDGAREGLIEGKWDPIAELIEGKDEVAKTATKLPYMAA